MIIFFFKIFHQYCEIYFVEMGKNNNEKLILWVSSHPVIWYITGENYNNRNKKIVAWAAVPQVFNILFCNAIVKIFYILHNIVRTKEGGYQLEDILRMIEWSDILGETTKNIHVRSCADAEYFLNKFRKIQLKYHALTN